MRLRWSHPEVARRGKAWTLFVTTVLYGAVWLLRIVVDDPQKPVSLLYVVPIAIVAAYFGVRGGFVAALVGLGLYELWILVVDSGGAAHDAFQYVARAAPFFVVGIGLGWFADRLRATVATLRTEATVTREVAGATTLEEGTAAAVSTLGRCLAAGAVAYWTRDGDALRRTDLWCAPGFERLSETGAEEIAAKEVAAADEPWTLSVADLDRRRLRGVVRRGLAVAVRADGVEFGVVELYEPSSKPGTADVTGALRTTGTTLGLFVARMLMAAELVGARDEAERANRAKSEFLSRMSHELRTPLNAILGFGQLLQMDELSDDQRESVDHIVKAGAHLLSLINEVLDIARIEAGRLSLSVEHVHLETVLRESCDLIRPLAADRELSLSIDGRGLDCWVMTDYQRLKQVLLNLLSNAVKYNRHGGRIDVVVEPSGEFARISVRDTGLGIPPETLPRLFSAFERGGVERSGVEGTGLGLALSKRLMEALGGNIGVESVPGSGSRFWVDVPRAARPADSVHEAVPTISRDASRPSVLYIEDNLANLRLVEQICDTRADVDVIAAMQGKLGIDLARRHAPAVILLDLHLPDIDGEDVLRLLRGYDETRETPVIVLTAEASPSKVTRLASLGVMAYLTKPINVEEFVTTLSAVLGAAAPAPAVPAEHPPVTVLATEPGDA